MTPTQLRAALDALHWTQRGLAVIIGWSEGTVRAWCRGKPGIPADVAAWLAVMAAHARANPPPMRGVKVETSNDAR